MRSPSEHPIASERRSTTLWSGAVFCLLFALYVLKPARDGLLAASDGLGGDKAALKAWTILFQALAMIALAPLYIRIARVTSRRRMLVGVNMVLALQLVALWVALPLLAAASSGGLAVGLYISVGMFSLVVVAEFWALAVDYFGDAAGKRMIPRIALSGSAGAVAGAWLVATGIERELLHTPTLLPIAAAALVSAALLVWRASSYRRPELPSVEAQLVPAAAASPAPTASPLALVLGHKYLLAAALVVAALNWVGTTGETLLFASVQGLLEREALSHGLVDADCLRSFVADGTTAFFASLFLWANLGTLVLQGLVTARLTPLRGTRPLLFAMPIVAILAYSTAALLPMLGVLKALKVAESATSRSLGSTASHLVWLPTTREMKRRAKALIDTVFVRIGDVMAVLTLFVGSHLLHLDTQQLYVVNAVLAAGWLTAAGVLAREHGRLSARRLHQGFPGRTVATP